MKRRVLYSIMALSLVLGPALLLAMPADADDQPHTGNSVDVYLSVSPSVQYRDDAVNYTVVTINSAAVLGANPAWIDVTFTPPGPEGTASGTPVVLATGLYLNVGDTVTWDPASNPELRVWLDGIDEGVEVAYARVEYYVVYDAETPYDASGSKNIPITLLGFAQLGDFVWHDLNRDGIQDEGEPGIADVTVYLWSADPDSCEPFEIVQTTLTDADGYYLFDQLRAGDYRVQFVLPEGNWAFTEPFVGADPAVDSNVDRATGISGCVDLEAGDSDMTIDAGMYQLYELLTVEKNLITSYTRTHIWEIDKWVETDFGHTIDEDISKIWLVPDGTGDETATWYVCVTYSGFIDSDFNVSGTITITNASAADAVITGVVDELCGDEIDIEWPEGTTFPYTLAPTESLEGTYSHDLDDRLEDCDNVVTVTTEMGEYTDEAEVIWGDPDEEIDKVVIIEDDSDLLGTVILGTLDADDFQGDQEHCFDYSEGFAWEDYDAPDPASWDIDNIARVIGDDAEVLDAADAKLKINWIINPDTRVTIDASAYLVPADDSIDLTVTEENTGDVDLTDVYVEVWRNGDLIVTLDETTAIESMTADGILEVGETWIWDGSTNTELAEIVITDTTTFVALGFGTDPLGNEVSFAAGYQGERDELTVATISTGIDLEKAVWDGDTWHDADAPTGPYLQSTMNPVMFQFVITNTGNVTLSSVTLSDVPHITAFYINQALTNPAEFPIASLAPSESVTVYGSLPWAAGQQTNTATATGTPPVGANVSDTNPANYFGYEPAPPSPPPVVVGWTTYPVNKASVLSPLIVLLVALAASAGLFIVRRRRSHARG